MLARNKPPDSSEKVAGLGGHMIFGLAIGVLLILRLGTRVRSTHPPHASTGHDLLDRLGRWTHWGFYFLIAGMVLTGLTTAIGLGLFPIVYGGTAQTLPAELATFAPRLAHGVVAVVLVALIALHIVAAIYHQAVLKDGLLRRMWFGNRTS